MKLLADFHTAILKNNPEKIAPAIKAHPRLSPEQQFAIYADGYRIRLAQAVRSDYPALVAYLGDKVFDESALRYIEQNSPKSYNLDFYPHKFAEFLGNNSEDVFAVELAALESAIAEVFMLPDSEPLAPDALAKLSSEEFGEMILPLRKAAKLLSFSYDVNGWLNEQRAGNTRQLPEAANQFLLVYRHNNEVQRLPVSEAGFALLKELATGKTVSDALDLVINKTPDYSEEITTNLQNWFAQWLVSGVFAGQGICCG